ncbi:MAG: DUF2892 domain-containing protein [Pseudomonadota bacterium]
MIERNLSNLERLIRLLLGLVAGYWVITRPEANAIEMFVMLIAVFLILNGIFSRCYLWYMLNINTATDNSKDNPCRTSPLN